MINGIFNSELKVYYLALATAFVAATMALIFLIFKSVATLIMTMSAILIVVVAMIILGAAVYLDFIEGRLDTSYLHQIKKD
ncbi:MAG: hypothetical protein IBX40_06860 [Methanosarcinales archaeon]|nr:hypothetical protein [Methanosarcinales archaeon]